MITDPQEIHELTAFFSWTAWASAAERPGHNYSYTNNWPPEPRVDNTPTADIVVWSGLSLTALLVGLGALFALYGRWSRNIGWHASEQPALAFRQPGEVQITPAQKVTAWFFFVVAALFLVQALLGGAIEHYRADLSTFFGIRPCAGAAVQPGPHLARAAVAAVDGGGVPRGRHLPHARSSRAGSHGDSTGWPGVCSARW